ncbi:papain-like cysteine peptidase [Ruminococcaceae bacterium OttesenSCG-928-A16]|nr:papain-like cysteine peptidase [Ruminococcaceae bacterium OttesenSCG-928-A16]
MKLSQIKGVYDCAISLGAPCQPAQQLKMHNLRSFSGPFDWTVLESVPCLIKAIDTKFENYFALENLTVKEKHGHTYLVYDELYECMSVHDFPYVENDDPSKIFDVYPAFIEKMQRRIQRFYSRISDSQRTLFVRFHASHQDAQNLQKYLKALVKNDFTLLVLNETDTPRLIEENWDIENTYAARIFQTPEIPWQGYTPHWDQILSGISLNNTAHNPLDIHDDPIL